MNTETSDFNNENKFTLPYFNYPKEGSSCSKYWNYNFTLPNIGNYPIPNNAKVFSNHSTVIKWAESA